MPLQELFSTRLAAEIAVGVIGKGTLLLAMGWMIVRLPRTLSAAQRHGVWSAVFALALLLPVADAVLPGPDIPLLHYPSEVLTFEYRPATPLASEGVPTWNGAGAIQVASGSGRPAATGPVRPSSAGAASSSSPSGVILLVFLAAWAAGVVVLSVRLVGHWFRIVTFVRSGTGVRPGSRVGRLVRREADRLGLRRTIRVVYTPGLRVPSTAGIVRPVLLLPPEAAGWDHERLRPVVLHELLHVCRWDLATHQVAELARILYWLNPLLWTAHREASEERERACDRAVIEDGVPARIYAGALVSMARRCRRAAPAGSLSMARTSGGLRDRVESVLTPPRRRPAPTWLAPAAALLLTVATLPLATVEVLAVPAGSGTVEELASQLTDGSVEVRLRSVRNLALRPAGESRRLLTGALLRDDDPRVRAAAAAALGVHASAETLPLLATAAADPANPVRVRRAAAEAMSFIHDQATVDRLVPLLEADDPGVRWLALKGLERMGPADRETRDAFARALFNDPEPRNRRAAALALGTIECESARRLLARALRRDRSRLVRHAVADLLGRHPPGRPGRRKLRHQVPSVVPP